MRPSCENPYLVVEISGTTSIWASSEDILIGRGSRREKEREKQRGEREEEGEKRKREKRQQERRTNIPGCLLPMA